MNVTLAFTRAFFVILSIFFFTTYMVAGAEGHTLAHGAMGVAAGTAFGALLIGFELLFKRFNLRSLNIAILGLFVGYLLGQALLWVLSSILEISQASIHLAPSALEMLQIAIFLFGLYLGTLMTLRGSDEFYVSLPFVRLSPTAQKRRDLLIDASLLFDPRLLDLAASGVLDQQLLLPRFLLKDLYAQVESSDEQLKGKAKRALDLVRKLESLPHLGLRYHETDFPEVKDPMGKMTRLARLLEANILTADMSRIQLPSVEGVRFINLHTLSNALKPLMQAGEHIRIKIQRYGKEPRQGVGYLDDGTMVVVNGGGDYIGEVIEAQVLSVKHTTSGRMIFCNARDEEGRYPTYHGEHDE